MNKIIGNNNGVALVFVLWVLVFLTVVAASFGLSIQKNSDRTFYEGLHTKAHYIAHAGIQKTIAGMRDGLNYNTPEVYRVNVPLSPEPFGEGQFQVFIDNDSGKVNLNQAGPELLRMLLNSADLTDHEKDVIVDSILDWRDKDSLRRLNGAETDYYESLPQPYQCRNGDFMTVGELLKVRGMTRDIFDTCMKGRLSVKKDENERLPVRSGIQEYLQLENRPDTTGIQTFLTLEKRLETSRIGRQYDYSKINVNAASPHMLMALPGMTASLVNVIMDFRKKNDFKSLAELERITGSTVFRQMASYVSLDMSRYYTVTSVAAVNGSDIIQQVTYEFWLDNTDQSGYNILQRY